LHGHFNITIIHYNSNYYIDTKIKLKGEVSIEYWNQYRHCCSKHLHVKKQRIMAILGSQLETTLNDDDDDRHKEGHQYWMGYKEIEY
jgi:hypothetical protein